MSFKEIVRNLRKEQTSSEFIIWQAVRNNKLGFKVKRQHPISFVYEKRRRLFVADFYVPIKKLVIEIDGSIHLFQEDYDKLRSELIVNLGYHVVRFTNGKVLDNLSSVLDEIIKFPSPSVRMERG